MNNNRFCHDIFLKKTIILFHILQVLHTYCLSEYILYIVNLMKHKSLQVCNTRSYPKNLNRGIIILPNYAIVPVSTVQSNGQSTVNATIVKDC